MKKVVLSVTNDLVTDQRVHKVATSLHSKGFQVMLVGRLLSQSLPLQRDYSTHRMSLLFTKGPFFYAEYNLRLFLYLLRAHADIIVSNDLDTLPASFLVSRIYHRPLVYDTHEFYTGVPELMRRPLVRKIWEKIESAIFPHLQYLFTVNDSIAAIYHKKYHKPFVIVRNVPLRIEHWDVNTRESSGLPAGKKIIILQGAGININRGAEEAIHAMTYLKNAVLLIIGGGDVVEALKEMVINLHLESKVIFKPRMPYWEMMQYTRLADIGLTIDKDTNLNYRYSLPNKLFDYIQAEIPVLCTDLVEVAGIVRSYDIGRIADCLEPLYLSELMSAMLTDEVQRRRWKKNLSQAAETLCWQKEESQLMKIYDQLR